MNTNETKNLWEARKAAAAELRELAPRAGKMTAEERALEAKLNVELDELDAKLDKATSARSSDAPEVLIPEMRTTARGAKAGETAADILGGYSQRALSEGTAAAGGFLVAEEHSSVINADIILRSNLAQRCRLITTESSVTRIPRLTTNVEGTWEAEAATIAQNDPVFAEVEVTTHKLATLNILSNEVAADSNPDIVKSVGESALDAISRGVENAIVNGAGDGSDQPLGLRTAGQSIPETSQGGAITLAGVAGEVETLVTQGLDASELTMVMAPRTWYQLAALTETGGAYMLGDPSSGAPLSLFGVQVVLSPHVSITETVSDSFILTGSFKYYGLVLRKAAELRVDQSWRFDTDETAVRVVTRVGGELLDPSAFSILDGITA